MTRIDLFHRHLFVKDDGTIISDKMRVIPQFDNGRGYKFVRFMAKTFYIHRLVLCAATDKAYWYNMEVHHIDHNRANNQINNLEWVTKKENCIGLTKNLSRPCRFSDAQIIDIRARRLSGKKVKDIAKEFNMSSDYVYLIIGNRYKTNIT